MMCGAEKNRQHAEEFSPRDIVRSGSRNPVLTSIKNASGVRLREQKNY
jgi:hypothetical protein